MQGTSTVPLPIPIPSMAPPTPATAPPSLETLATMHSSTVSTLVDLFTLALTHPGRREGDRELQDAKKRVAELEEEVERLKEGKRGDSVGKVEPQFVTLLIDGDGAIFNGDFLKQGATGGHVAAKLLLSSLPGFIASTGPPELAPHAARLAKNAVVNVIVNKFGLAGAVVKAGIVSSFSTVADFFLAFSQAHSNINVIDSGPGKEASDSKIHAQLHFYSALPSCGLTILAGSHDAGYANVLRSLTTEGRDVVLLRGGHTAWLLEGICPTGEIEGLFIQGKVGSLTSVGGAVGTGMPSPAPLGSAARPVISNGKITEEARRKEEETAREKKRMRRRLRREEERGKKQAVQDDRNARALLSDSEDESEEEESEDEAEALVIDEEWQDTDGTDTVDDLADTLARQFAEVQIRSAKKVESFVTPSRATKPSLASGKKAKQEPAVEATPVRRRADQEETSRPTPKQPFKTPLREMTKAPQSWDTLINTPAGARTGGKAKATPRVGMTPKGAERGEENSVPVQGADRALRYLTPRPCHKHYLAKDGCDNKSCAFGHHYRLNPGQLQYLRKLAAEMPCPWLKLGRCSYSDETCIYGHQCPHADHCLYGSSCRFNELPDGGHNGKGEAATMM